MGGFTEAMSAIMVQFNMLLGITAMLGPVGFIMMPCLTMILDMMSVIISAMSFDYFSMAQMEYNKLGDYANAERCANEAYGALKNTIQLYAFTFVMPLVISAAKAGCGSGFAETASEDIKNTDNPKYITKIKWGINEINARPYGNGYWGERIPQKNLRVDKFELKINPNNESFYLPHPNGGYVQFENLVGNTVQDGKLIMNQRSFYHVEDLPQFAQNKVIEEASRQVEAAKLAGYNVEWLVSEKEAVEQLTRLFKKMNIDIEVKYYSE